MIRLRGFRGRLRRSLAAWLGRTALVVLYHRVVPEAPHDPERLCVSTDRFREQLQWLRDHFEMISAEQLGRLVAARWVGGPYAVVTFDDGYADNLHHALPVLESLGVPATAFVTTGPVRSGRPFWWDELAGLIMSDHWDGDHLHWTGPNGLPVRVANTAGWRELAYRRMHELIKPLPVDERLAWLDRIRWSLGVSPKPLADGDQRPLTIAELGRLAASGCVGIGAHTVDHVVLGAQPIDEQRRQIGQSKADLEAWLGRRVDTFAYPFGMGEDIGPTAARLVREAGFSVAFANEGGFAWPGSARGGIDRQLVRDWSADELARRVLGVLSGRRQIA